MFGISPLGWLHTLGSLPAIPLAVYMFARHGRITPRSTAGLLYFLSMLIGSLTVFLVARQAASPIIDAVTLCLLIAGYGVGHLAILGRARRYLETIFLSLTAFLLAIPTVSETLRRVPDGHPIATDEQSPILLGVQAAIAVALIVGLTLQMIRLRREGHRSAS